jgi:hypothetical protein
MPTISSCGDVALDGCHARAGRTVHHMSIRHPLGLEATPHGLRVLFHDAPAALLSREIPHLRELLSELTRQQPPRPLWLDINDVNHITDYRLVLRAVPVDVQRDELGCLVAILHSNVPRRLRSDHPQFAKLEAMLLQALEQEQPLLLVPSVGDGYLIEHLCGVEEAQPRAKTVAMA